MDSNWGDTPRPLRERAKKSDYNFIDYAFNLRFVDKHAHVTRPQPGQFCPIFDFGLSEVADFTLARRLKHTQ